MDTTLNDINHINAFDESGMLKVLERFPEDCHAAIIRAQKVPLGSISSKRFSEVVFAGMGGSSLGGKLIIDWLWKECDVPLVLSRGYHLPSFVNDETLVFTVSYSGNTEETLSMLSEALRVGASTITVTSGGTMGNIAMENGLPMIPLPKGYRPRSAIPHQFFSLATTMHKLGFIKRLWVETSEALKTIESLRDETSIDVPIDENIAKKIALRLRDKMPIVYGSSLLEGVAYRLRSQLNENSKVPSGSGSFPEAFHNAVLGSEGHSKVLENLAILLLRDNEDNDGINIKIEKFKECFTPKVKEIIDLEARGSGRLSKILSLVYLGDYISTYLGVLYGHDPSTNLSIDKLKKV
ncbi:bifunctional phosphoglucose/phosphomannose isomerase [Candidatus Bathyarchaeota archaeon]|jgi:glucose/mannose-6-phosphate isomerase|nr:bifunctional phosphoglucose/phosphomannose isomerase [Candidatus Bathyarchaeota archaeon]